MLVAWGVFSPSAAVIVHAGTGWTRCGNPIAEPTGLGGSWIGVVSIAIIHRAEQRTLWIELESFLVVFGYDLGFRLLFR